METGSYQDVAKYAEANTVHPQRVAIAYHIRTGQYDLALELLRTNGASSKTEEENPEDTPSRFAELQMMIEHLRAIETPPPAEAL